MFQEDILKMLKILKVLNGYKKIKLIGLRPISALVDITNYVTFDLGRPLHVYDADKINGNLKKCVTQKK